MEPTVTLTQDGREGRVAYSEGLRTIAGYQEFGGADVVAVVSMGSADEWRVHHRWAVDRRAQILRHVADEVIRQRAPSCSAEIDQVSGSIVLRSPVTDIAAGLVRPAAASSGRTLAAKPADVSWVRRYGQLKGKVGLIALAAVLAFGAAMWVKTRVLVVQPGKGIPVGSTVRGGTHLATLIRQLQPYTPSLNHDGSTERFSLSIFLVPLDGSAPQLVRLVRDLPPGSYSLARVIGSDGKTMWISINGLYGVDLRSYAPVSEADVIQANPELDPDRLGDTRGMDILDGRLQIVADDRSAAWSLEPATFKAERVAPRHVYRPLSNPPPSLDEPLSLTSPDSVLMLHKSGDDLGAQSTLLVSRVHAEGGQPLWTVDTGINPSKLEQILPADASTVFVGTRPPVPDQLSEPLLVILDHATGQRTTHSLWR